MRILFSISSLAVEAGGTAVAACGLAAALAERGHQVTIVALRGSGTAVEPPGLCVKYFEPDRRGAALGASGEMKAYLGAHIRDFDVAHIHGIWQRPGHYAAEAARRGGVPWVVTPAGMLDRASLAMGRRWAKRLAWRLWDGPMVRGAAAVHCLNQAEYRCAPWIRGWPVVVIGNGVEAEVFEQLPQRGEFRRRLATRGPGGTAAAMRRGGKAPLVADAAGYPKNGNRKWFSASGHASGCDWPMVLFLGRVHPKKGLERLLPVWKTVRREHGDSLLVIAGSGRAAYVRSLQDLCDRLGIEETVVWVGQLTGRDKWAALADADVFVLPSHQEGFSLAITEAMAAACPVVITRECNFDEVATVNAGVVVEAGGPDVPERFAAEVSALLGDAARRRMLGENGQRLVRQRYTWPIIAGQMERVYEAIVTGEALPGDLRAAREF